MATRSGGHHFGPSLHKFTFSQSIRTSHILTTSLSPCSFYNLKASTAPFFYEALLPFIFWVQVMHIRILLGLFKQLKLLCYFTTRKLLGHAFLTAFETSSAKPQELLFINVRKPVDTCSKISVSRSCWHHKVTTWVWEAFLNLCLIQRCASIPLLSGALPEWTICGFAKKKAATKQRATCGFRCT